MRDSRTREVDALTCAFLDQLAARFGDDAQLVPRRRLCVVIAGQLVPVTVSPYAAPSDSSSDCPWVLRITIGKYSLPPAAKLKRLGDRIGRTSPFGASLELSLLPDQLLSAANWIAEWMKRQANGEDCPPCPPFPLEDPADQRFRQANSTWRASDYIWSAAAKEAYSNWEEVAAGRRADETQFAVSVFADKYPKVDAPLSPPVYHPPTVPDNWSKDGDVRYASFFRPGTRGGSYLVGERVNVELRAACGRGYIILPANVGKHKFWRAWHNTWWEYCQLPKHRRPFVRVVVGRQLADAARKLTLRWDWITMDPPADPTEDDSEDPRSEPWRASEAQSSWEKLDRRLSQFYDALPRGECRRLFGHAGRAPACATVGTVAARADNDAPLQWVMSWLASHYPKEVAT